MPGIQIVGAGNNMPAQVNDEGRLRTVTTSTNPEYHVNWEHGLTFYLQINTTPAAADSVFLYIKNTSDNPLILENLFIYAGTSEEVNVYRNPTGTPTGTTAKKPLNNNFGSNKEAVGDFLYGTDIEGLTTDQLFNTLPVLANSNNAYSFRNWVILLRNSTICFSVSTGGIALDISLPFFYLIGEL